MKRWIVLYIIILWLAPAMRAQQCMHNLVVKFCNEQTIVFALKEKPMATLHADSLCMQTEQFQATYLRDEICDFYFLQAPDDTNPLPEQTIYIAYLNDHTIRINGVQKGDKATIYSVDGKLLLAQMINNNEYILNLNAYTGGLYLIQVQYKHKDTDTEQVISFKIIR